MAARLGYPGQDVCSKPSRGLPFKQTEPCPGWNLVRSPIASVSMHTPQTRSGHIDAIAQSGTFVNGRFSSCGIQVWY